MGVQGRAPYAPTSAGGPPIAALANGLRLLALLSDLTNVLDASLAKGSSTVLEAARVGERGAFLWLLVPFVRKGLIEGVYGSGRCWRCATQRGVAGDDSNDARVGGGNQQGRDEGSSNISAFTFHLCLNSCMSANHYCAY